MNVLLDILFVAFFFILLLALVVGLIKPKLVLIWSKKPTRLKVIGWFLLAAFIYLMIVGIRSQRRDARLSQEDSIYTNTETTQPYTPETTQPYTPEIAQPTTPEIAQPTTPKPMKSNPDFNGLPVKLTIEGKDYIFHDLKVSKIGDDIYITAYTKSDVTYSLGSHSSRGDFPIWCIYLGGAQYWTSYVELKQTDVPNEIAFVYGPFSFSKVREIVFFEKERTSNQRGVVYNGEYSYKSE